MAQIAAEKDVSPKENQLSIVEASSNQAIGEEVRDDILDNHSETRAVSRVDSLENVVRKLGSGLAFIGTIASGL